MVLPVALAGGVAALGSTIGLIKGLSKASEKDKLKYAEQIQSLEYAHKQAEQKLELQTLSEKNRHEEFMKMLEIWDNALKLAGEMITGAKSGDCVGLSGNCVGLSGN